MKPLKVVLDTSVLISAIVFGGKPRKILQSAILGKIRLVLSDVLLDELKGVLEGPKFRYSSQMSKIVVNELTAIAEIVLPTMTVHRIKSDPDDNRVLECAMAGDADFIVSGDFHLLELNEFNKIQICPPADFIKKL